MPKYVKGVVAVGITVGIHMLASCAAEENAAEVATEAEEAGVARVSIVEPAADAEVGPDVRVVLAAEGVLVEPAGGTRVEGSGHHHLFLNREVTPAGQPIPMGEDGIVHLGQGTAEHTFTALAPGRHQVIAVLAYGDHVPMAGVATDTVSFTVR